MVNEVRETIRELAAEGMKMFIVYKEVSLVREVTSKVVFMADGEVVESGTPQQIFEHPEKARTQQFIGKILRH